MRVMTRVGSRALLAAAWVFAAALAAAEPRAARIAAVSEPELSGWDARIDRMLREGELRLRQVREDTLIAGRVHQRLAQIHRGVPVFGGELVRQSDAAGAVSVFGTLYEGIDLDTRALLGADRAVAVVRDKGGFPFGSEGAPQLTVLPKADGTYALTWRLRARLKGDIRMLFVDARDGGVVLDFSDLKSQAVGLGTGVLSDQKKMSTRSQGSAFVADDKLRPPAIRTYDFKGDIFKILFLESIDDLQPADLAADSDNTWTDGANVDAHAYAGWVYDYYFKRHGRRGLDNNDITILSITHPVRRDEIFDSPNIDFIGSLYLNAFYAGDGLMVYGEGLPNFLVDSQGRSWNYLSGGLDVVAHELTHGVTDYSSRLIYQNESGALNESFSDMMGIGVEFYFQAAGSGPLRADYLLGEDIITPGGLRSMQSPLAYGDPDHYSIRYTGSEDNGGVHINSGIPNNVFYLAIEGGRNATSGMAVQGVGAGNREQIEKTFYRAFALLLPPSANFATARAASIQSARDLYGAGSAVERAVTEAWSAVGVN